MSRIPSHPFDIHGVAERLAAGNGGYETVHESPGIEVGVYVLVAPEPDRQQPHDDDEIYVVLEGHGARSLSRAKTSPSRRDTRSSSPREPNTASRDTRA